MNFINIFEILRGFRIYNIHPYSLAEVFFSFFILDSLYTPKLIYTHNDVVQGKCPVTKAKRGVCKCAEVKKGKFAHNDHDKQDETIIPWCLPHTSNR